MNMHVLNELIKQGHIKSYNYTVTANGQTIYYVRMNDGSERIVKGE